MIQDSASRMQRSSRSQNPEHSCGWPARWCCLEGRRLPDADTYRVADRGRQDGRWCAISSLAPALWMSPTESVRAQDRKTCWSTSWTDVEPAETPCTRSSHMLLGVACCSKVDEETRPTIPNAKVYKNPSSWDQTLPASTRSIVFSHNEQRPVLDGRPGHQMTLCELGPCKPCDR